MAGSVGNITTDITREGLVFNMDAANRASYPKTGTTATDTVNSDIATLTGTSGTNITPQFLPLTGSGVFNYDGTDDCLLIDNHSIIPDGSTGFTKSAWIYGWSNSNQDIITAYYPGGNQGTTIESRHSTNTNGFKAWINLSTGWHGNENDLEWSSPNQWINLTSTWNKASGEFILRVNTVYQTITTGATGDYTWPNCDFAIGSMSPGSTRHYYSGNIGPVHVYNRALSSTEILHNYNALKGRFI